MHEMAVDEANLKVLDIWICTEYQIVLISLDIKTQHCLRCKKYLQ